MQESKTEIQLNAKPPCWVLSQLPFCYPNYFLPGDLERQIEAFIEHYNHRRTLHSPGHG